MLIVLLPVLMFGVLTYQLCVDAGHPILAWHLAGLIAIVGGIYGAWIDFRNGR